MADLQEIIKELESIESSLNNSDTDTASLDLHLLIVELLDEAKINAQYLSEINRIKIKEEVQNDLLIRYSMYSIYIRCALSHINNGLKIGGCINPQGFRMNNVYNNHPNANTSNVGKIDKLELTDYLTAIKGNDELKESIENVLVDGSKINAIKILRTYMEVELDAKSTTTLRGCKDAIDFYALRYTLTKKIKWCRDMIEVYCNANGYGKEDARKD